MRLALTPEPPMPMGAGFLGMRAVEQQHLEQRWTLWQFSEDGRGVGRLKTPSSSVCMSVVNEACGWHCRRGGDPRPFRAAPRRRSGR